MKRTSCNISETRDLTDKELNEITRAVGEGVRSQSIIVSGIIQANIKAEFADCRKNISKRLTTGKPIAA